MTLQEITDYCLTKAGAYLDYPFSPIFPVIKVKAPSQEKGRIFAQPFILRGQEKVTLNCSPDSAEYYRGTYPGSVTRGYHCPPVQQPHFNTVYLDGSVPDKEILLMIDHAYDVVVAKYPKYIQRELRELQELQELQELRESRKSRELRESRESRAPRKSARKPIKLVSFDLDDTLTRDIHSVLLPCILNGKEKECRDIDSREEAGELDYIAADYLKVKLFEGLAVKRIKESFLDIARPLANIKYVVDKLHESGIKCVVVTVGPKQVAEAVRDIYGFDDCYGSDYEVKNGRFTGRILEYLSARGKPACVMDYCDQHDITPSECVAVGDGSTDIPVFGLCGASIAINAKPEVRREATYAIDTMDLADILPFITRNT